MILTTKHSKSVAIAPPFWSQLGAGVLEYAVDTDLLGTFSGEVEREGSALDTARRKCELAFEKLGSKVDYALASEGTFGPHPYLPFLPCDHEILYFIDRQRGFNLHLSHLSEKTNYRMQLVESREALDKFAALVDFPSHALILRPSNRECRMPVFKGIYTTEALEEAFFESRKISADGTVWVETDMRAHMNPTRMSVIEELAGKLADRLATHCPRCDLPGWGRVRVKDGLECRDCGSRTRMIESEIAGCVQCGHEEIHYPTDRIEKAEPAHCDFCNP